MSDIIKTINTLRQQEKNGPENIFPVLEKELKEALTIYWNKAGDIIEGSGIGLLDPPEDYLSLESNFFSALFLYSYHRADIPSSRRILYATINQCLRGMVTGCDNLLDDEYKKTLDTDLPEMGIRFRSVLDIMVSDRILFETLLTSLRDNKKILEASITSLRALIKSGAQEASEEGGINEILQPEQVINHIHHFKTGILFKCPWAVPKILENIDVSKVESLSNALYNIGIGCQILDDMVDLARDVRRKRHNFLISIIYHGDALDEQKLLKSFMLSEITEDDLLMSLPKAKAMALSAASSRLKEGLMDLFEEKHQILVEPAFVFLASRIGADKYFTE